jgi:hypothetical protein
LRVVIPAVFLLDVFFWSSRSPTFVPIAWGRLGFGIFFQILSLGLLSQLPLIEVFPCNAAFSNGLARRILAIIVPFLVFSWIGADLVHKGLHEGGTPLTYRAQR